MLTYIIILDCVHVNRLARAIFGVFVEILDGFQSST